MPTNSADELRLRPSDLVDWRPILAAAFLFSNDHFLKGAQVLPAWLTGKLSDFAGLYCFPIVLTVLLEAWGRACNRALTRHQIANICIVATGFVFGALKTMPALAEWTSQHIGRVVCDPTDLLALSVLPFAHRYLVIPVRRANTRLRIQALAALITTLPCLATQPVPLRRGYAMWTFVDRIPLQTPCGPVEAWVAKSGKEGLGVTLHLQTARPACAFSTAHASLSLHDQNIVASATFPAAAEERDGERFIYLPFLFDNNKAWNRGWNQATLDLQLRVESTDLRWQRKLVQYHEGYRVFEGRREGNLRSNSSSSPPKPSKAY
jgi:hypothetical protein